MKIGIIGTRGIPNHYGGFEQFAEYLSVGLVKRGHEVTVYNSHKHPYQESSWNGVQIIHCNDLEHKIGTIGQFFYDRNCIIDSKKRNFDIILQLGYTSSSIWGRWLPKKKSVITTNMDGLEWKRSKYSKNVQRFLKHAERLGVKHSDYLIADSIGIQTYLKEKYNSDSLYIPYGANNFDKPNLQVVNSYHLEAFEYNMLIARLEPENNIETILDGVAESKSDRKFLVIGNTSTPFGKRMMSKFKSNDKILFLGAIYNLEHLNNLRHFSNLYFHGHSVGGTNPSLLEAMSSNSLICAHKNVFNSSILESDALYFENSADVSNTLDIVKRKDHDSKIEQNRIKIEQKYSWEQIIDAYEKHFKKIT